MKLRKMYNQLKAIKEAIEVYHFALNNRKHGGIAQDKCIRSIESILDAMEASQCINTADALPRCPTCGKPEDCEIGENGEVIVRR